MREVALGSIVLVTPRTVKVSRTSYYTRFHDRRPKVKDRRQMKSDLELVVKDWTSLGKVPEVGWSSIGSLDFQDLFRDKATLNDRVEQSICLTCPEFSKHVCSGIL